MKECFKCGEAKPLTEFYRHRSMADGHLGKCKECTKADSAARFAEKREEIREYDRRRSRTPKRRAKVRQYAANGRARSPEKAIARNAVANAIRDGRLVRLPCEVCGSPNSEGHHPDYSKPLDVVWLCRAHHRLEHRRLAEAA